jgi:cell wall-associated NlpC family hydrolase
MSGEVPASKRIGFAKLQPGDVLFFGDKGPRSKPAQVGNTGIYLGNGWFIHSSDYGVAIAPFAGWYRSSFAWARRPLAEAGLSN